MCTAPLDIPNAAVVPCMEGSRIIPSGCQCTAVCKSGFVATTNLTCDWGAIHPTRFGCVEHALALDHDAAESFWNAATPLPGGGTLRPPREAVPSWSSPYTTTLIEAPDASVGASTGALDGPGIVIVVIMVAMVLGVLAFIVAVIIALRRRAAAAEAAREWENAMDQVNIGVGKHRRKRRGQARVAFSASNRS